MVRQLRLAHFFVLRRVEKKMMDTVGIAAEIDHLGRVHLPKKMREVHALDGEVEIVLTKEGLLIRNPRYTLVKRSESEA